MAKIELIMQNDDAIFSPHPRIGIEGGGRAEIVAMSEKVIFLEVSRMGEFAELERLRRIYRRDCHSSEVRKVGITDRAAPAFVFPWAV